MFDGFWFLIVLGILFIVLKISADIYKEMKHKECVYYKVTKNSLFKVNQDLGLRGEYLIYKELSAFEKFGVYFLFNLYIPKSENETTEIDVLMISSKGLFVIESKNYSGWIFGSEKNLKWCQTLPTGRRKSHKESFYNPILQNKTHIIALKNLLKKDIPFKSIIVFSDRCELKNINVASRDIKVINRCEVSSVVSKYFDSMPDVLTLDEVNCIFNDLYAYVNVTDDVKRKHIDNINNMLHDIDDENFTNQKPIKLERNVESIVKPIDKAEYKLKTEPENKEESKLKTEIRDESKLNATTKTDDTISLSNAQDKKMSNEDSEAQSNITQESSLDNKCDTVTPKKEEKSQPMKCPFCGATLVLRTATKGVHAGDKFYGCSNYPKCRFIQNIKKTPNGKIPNS